MQPRIQMLSQKEIEHVDKLTREILEKVGFICEDQEAMDLFENAGARVESSEKRVYLPGELIDQTISHCKGSVKLYGRDGRKPLEIGEGNVHFGTTGFATNVLDRQTGQYRASLTSDLQEFIRLCDVLDPPDYILPSIGVTDQDPEIVDLYEFKTAMLNTTKHVQTQANTRENAKKIIKMAEFIAGGAETLREKPFMSILVTLTSPLHHRPDSMQLIIEAAQNGIPLFIESGPMAGATSPITLTHTVAMANAELLSSIALAKIVNPDVPVVYASWARIINMRNGNVSVGCPEFGMLRVATTQMGKYYGLPTGGGGTLSDSLFLDPQLGMELCSTAMLPALAGTNMIQGMGLLAGMNAASLENLVIASEAATYVRRVIRGIEVDPETHGYDLIEEVGPAGDFISTDHTLKNFRKEVWIPSILDCSAVTAAADADHKGVLGKAKAKADKLLSKYKGPKLPNNAEEELEKIVRSELL